MATLPENQNVDRQPVWMVWAASAGVWMFITALNSASVYEVYRSVGNVNVPGLLGLQCSQILTYVPLTPFVFFLALRHPIRRDGWANSLLIYGIGALLFAVAHSALRFLTPYAYYDPAVRNLVSGVWDAQARVFRFQWPMFRQLFFRTAVDDITGAYLPIVLVALAFEYYRRLRQKEVSTAQLEMQLARAHLRALKSQLQPHFLFNTLHSISALMLTDVSAADKTMSQLSDLLRMSLDDNDTQLTTLSRDLEFVNGYLAIETTRFGDRLSVRISVPANLLDAEVPHLLLQPLVENAVRHGISQRTTGGEICISAAQDDHSLHLWITDNGPGLSQGSGIRSSAGLGLKTTRQRLESLYGDAHSLEVRDKVDGGVEARVRIPFRLHMPLRAETGPTNF